MMPAARPRFRTDLVAEPIQEDGKRFIDVLDPDSGVGFRFYDVEYSLACAMDGERDLAGLVRWAREELGVEPSQRELGTVIATLGELGYLAGDRSGDGVGDLVEGVVTARPIEVPRVEDVELGTAGGAMAATGDLPASDVELGQAGGVSSPRVVLDDFGTGPELAPSGGDDFPAPPAAAAPVAQLKPRTSPDADTDGPTDLPRPVPLAAGDEDVSTDLSDHLAISASDVKEAVRASRVMQAVEMPADVAATIAAHEAEEEAAKAAAAKAAAEKAAAEKAAADKAAADRAAAEKAAADKAAAEKAAADRAAAEKAAADKAAAAERASQAVVRPAIEQSSSPIATAAPTTATPIAKGEAEPKVAVEPVAEPRTSRALIALLVAVILAAVAYLVWTQWLGKKAKDKPAATQVSRPTPPAQPVPPPPPPPPSSVLKEMAGTTSEIAAGRLGVVASVVADGATVIAGDELVRFAAPAKVTKLFNETKAELDTRLPAAIAAATVKFDAATKAGKPVAIKNAETALTALTTARTGVEAKLASLTAQLDAYVVRAQLAGKVKTKVVKGDKVANIEQAVVAITTPNTYTATFTLAAGHKKRSVGDSVTVTAKGTAQKSACTVTAVNGADLTIDCPADIAPNTPIVLE